MNTNCSRSVAVLVTALALLSVRVHAQIPTNQSLAITLGQGNARVNINDPSNSLWTIQTSSDMVHWSYVDYWKVHNGNFHNTYPRQNAGPGQYFRAIIDPTRKFEPDYYTTSLLLPNTPFNYHPTLPPY